MNRLLHWATDDWLLTTWIPRPERGSTQTSVCLISCEFPVPSLEQAIGIAEGGERAVRADAGRAGGATENRSDLREREIVISAEHEHLTLLGGQGPHRDR